MVAGQDTVRVAFTYAWWLTGDDDAATAAVRRACTTTDEPGGDDPVAALLGRIRSNAVSRRTMCPASEVALLHDAHGLPLDAAATVAAVDPADVRTELAHGRLEALRETVRADFPHPERLGGLAVGNPADVAHARQCPGCAQARTLLQRGRAELERLPPLPLPPALAQLSATVSGTGDDEPVAPTVHVARAFVALGLLLVVVALVIWVAQVVRTPPAEGAAPAPSAAIAPRALAAHRPAPAPDPAPEPEPPAIPADAVPPIDPDAFAIEAAGVVPTGADHPAPSGAALWPSDPIRLAVAYRGATAGMPLSAHWSVDGAPYLALGTTVSGQRSTHVFSTPVPPQGWPAGSHRVDILAGGSLVGVIDFTVGPAPPPGDR
jgi:hypothetical protein